MNDIQAREDVVKLVDTFYNKVRADDTIGYIFNNIIGDDWSHHLPLMYSFWSMVLLSEAGYTGQPVKAHLEVDRKERLEPAHFERWLQLWRATVDELFAGEKAEEAKKKAQLMADLIRMKVDMNRSGKLIQ